MKIADKENQYKTIGGVRLSHDEIVAWMPLPEPYKAEMEGDND